MVQARRHPETGRGRLPALEPAVALEVSGYSPLMRELLRLASGDAAIARLGAASNYLTNTVPYRLPQPGSVLADDLLLIWRGGVPMVVTALQLAAFVQSLNPGVAVMNPATAAGATLPMTAELGSVSAMLSAVTAAAATLSMTALVSGGGVVAAITPCTGVGGTPSLTAIKGSVAASLTGVDGNGATLPMTAIAGSQSALIAAATAAASSLTMTAIKGSVQAAIAAVDGNGATQAMAAIKGGLSASIAPIDGNGATLSMTATITGGTALVLDAISSGAKSSVVVAYSSARRLTEDYTGSLLRLRRASDDELEDFGYDGSGDLDVAAIATWVGSGDAYLVTLYDQSGNTNDLTQSTAADQIPFVLSGTIQTCGGQPAPYSLASAGSGDYLGITDSALPLGASDFAIWAVNERLSGETQPIFAAWFADGMYLGWDAATNNLCACAIGGYVYAPRASASYLGTTGGTTDERKCIIANFDVSTQIEAFVNSTSSFGTNSLVDASDYDWRAMGADAGYFPMRGPIAELIVFDGQLLDSSDRSVLMTDGTSYYT